MALGSEGVLATAERFTSGGNFVPAPSMTIARSGHVSVALGDGRVLVAGGITSDGTRTASAEIYDPVNGTWTEAGAMGQSRSAHTASLLSDGRVLLAAGSDSSGPLTSLEIFDPETDTFSAAGTLTVPRTGHATATLHDGRVLIVGGSDTSGPLGSAIIYNPDGSDIDELSAPALTTPRVGHTATTLLDGSVLILGGSDGTNDLDSAEIYDASASSLQPLAATLIAPRRDHVASLLPNNNSVLIAGGMTGALELYSAELFVPWTGTFEATGELAEPRTETFGTAVRGDGVILVPGGTNAVNGTLATAELYGFATVKTDKDDYAPGQTVTITGTGWEPNEEVILSLHEELDAECHDDLKLIAVADGKGRIINTEFAPDIHDIGVRFYLTATGLQSQAQNTFTDAAPPKLEQLFQCANQNFDWQTGNLGQSNSLYLEGDSVPYYTHITNLDVTKTYRITIEWDTSKGDKHALDYLTTFDRSYPPDDPCAEELTSCGAPSIYPIPADPIMAADPDFSGTQVGGDFSMWQGMITDVSGYTLEPSGLPGSPPVTVSADCLAGGCYDGDTSTRISVDFEPTCSDSPCDIVLSWGGHIASRADWGQDNAAVNIHRIAVSHAHRGLPRCHVRAA